MRRNTTQSSWMGWIRLSFVSFSHHQRKHRLFLLWPQTSRGKSFWQAPDQNVVVFERWPKQVFTKSMLSVMWVDKSLKLKVATVASSYECKYYRINGISLRDSIEKSENLRKLKLSEISKMSWEVTPFPRSCLTVGKPGLPTVQNYRTGVNPSQPQTSLCFITPVRSYAVTFILWKFLFRRNF